MQESYRIISMLAGTQGTLETVIVGPGIKRSGAQYRFSNAEEAQSFVEMLNLLYRGSGKRIQRGHTRVRRAAQRRTAGTRVRVARPGPVEQGDSASYQAREPETGRPRNAAGIGHRPARSGTRGRSRDPA